MTDQNAQVSRLHLPRPDPWSAGALAIAAFVLLPIAAVAVLALTPAENVWPHLAATVLPRYLGNTLLMAGGAGALAAVAGTGTAWLVTMYRFPGSRVLTVLLLAPLAVPAYVGAYALVDFLDYAGPVQTGLRAAFGWTSARDYWFPAVRSRGLAVAVLGAATYPYVYLLARAAFREQSGTAYEVARALGAGPWRMVLSVGLPLARPAIAAGTALAMMETVNDFGVVDYFGVQTLTTGIFSVWLSGGNAGGAAQLSLVILGVILALVAAERIARRRQRYYRLSRAQRPVAPQRIAGARGWLATAACALPFAAGFVVPVAVMAGHAAGSEAWLSPDLGEAFVHTATVAGAAAVLTVAAAVFLVWGIRVAGRRLPRLLLPATVIGYAAPGAVLAVGILIPMAALDHRVADLVLALTGRDPGLLVTGTAAGIVMAYVVRFFAIGQGAVDAAFGRIPPSLGLAARSLGRSPGATLRAVHLPLIRGSVLTALLLVFVDGVKELPATMLLRPFDYETLATRVHEKASLENLGDAAPAALLVTLTGLVAVALVARANR